MKRNNPKRLYTKCRGCGKRILKSRRKFCADCVKLDARLEIENISAKVRKVFWAYLRKHGRRCFFSGVSLEINDNTGPWYLVFGRLNPGDNSRIVPASALFAVMKGRFLNREFRHFVFALDDHRKKHLKVKRIPLVHWHGLGLSTGDKICDGCRRAAALKGREYCARCARLNLRMKRARYSREAINGVWEHIRKYGFVCYYTGMELDLDDPKSPWYLVFDHWIPRDPRKIVITSAVVNIMKNDLLEEEFWSFISRLANYHRYGTPVRKMKLAYWSRPYR
jgi:hypothetical protein